MADNKFVFRNNPALNNVAWEDLPRDEEENANWIHEIKWQYPKDGKEFAEEIKLFDQTRPIQREIIDHLMDSAQGQFMPKSVREYLVSLGLLDE